MSIQKLTQDFSNMVDRLIVSDISSRTVRAESSPPVVEDLTEARAEILRLYNEKTALMVHLRDSGSVLRSTAIELREIASVLDRQARKAAVSSNGLDLVCETTGTLQATEAKPGALEGRPA